MPSFTIKSSYIDTVTIAARHTYFQTIFSVLRGESYAEFTYEGAIQYLTMLAEELDQSINIEITTDMSLGKTHVLPDKQYSFVAFENYLNLLSYSINTYTIPIPSTPR